MSDKSKALCVEVREGAVCVCQGRESTGECCAGSKATLARTGGKRSASDSTHRSAAAAAAAVGISRSQVSSPASVTLTAAATA